MIDIKTLVSMAKFTSLPIETQLIYYMALGLMNEEGYANLNIIKNTPNSLQSTIREFDDCIDDLETRGFLQRVNAYGDVSISLEVARED